MSRDLLLLLEPSRCSPNATVFRKSTDASSQPTMTTRTGHLRLGAFLYPAVA
jgi:hypothetical protein